MFFHTVEPSIEAEKPKKTPADDFTIICSLCFSQNDFQEVSVNCSHVFCKSCLDHPSMTICPICRTPIGQKCKVSINTLVIAPKVAVETDFGTNHLDPHHELDGNRIGYEDEDEAVARQLQNMINNLEAATPPRPPRKTST